jgi:hypothetical protein
MTPALFWTLVLAAGLLCAVLVGARRLHRRLTDSSDAAEGLSFTEGLAAVRDRVASSRPVNLGSWPETLAGQALRAARPVPGGRVPATAYQVRCGAALYGAAAPYAEELETAFVEVLRDCSSPGDLPARVRVRFVYDETLRAEAYRMDMEFPHESPTTAPSGTVLYIPPARDPEPQQAEPEAADAVAEAPRSWWTLVLPDGSRHGLPAEGTTLVGADGSCDVVVREEHVSGRHLRLTVAQDRLELRDGAVVDQGDGRGHVRPSTNGTFLRGHPISTARLSADAEPVALRLGPVAELRVEYGDPGATEPMLAEVVTLSSAHVAGRQ